MTRDARDRLDDILHAIDEIDRRLVEELPDDALHDALCFQLLVIGEAVKHLDPDARRGTSEVPWQQIAGLRDLNTRRNSARSGHLAKSWEPT